MSERIRQSIAVSGINTAEPCHTVADGAMEDVLNMRYKNNAFINVCEPKIIAPISNTNGYKILYTMDCIHGEYIAITGHVIHSIHRVKIENGSIISVELISVILVGYTDLKLSHFGSVLYVNYLLNGALKEQCFIFKDDKFTAFSMDELEPPEFLITLESSSPGNGFGDSGSKYPVVLEYEKKANGDIIKTPLYNSHISGLLDSGYFVGHIFVAVAYCMNDGSVIKCSAIHGISSYHYTENTGAAGTGIFGKRVGSTSEFNETYSAKIEGIKPTITISVPDDIKNSKMIRSVVIIASRINPLYEYDKIREEFGKYGGSGDISSADGAYCGSNCILSESAIDLRQPMYQVVEMEIDDIKPITLTYTEHLKDIEFNSVYAASFSNHSMISSGHYEYNNRLHAYNTVTTPYLGFELTPFDNSLPISRNKYEWGDDVDVAMQVRLSINDDEYSVVRRFVAKTATYETTSKRYVMLNNLLTYPDARATGCELTISVVNTLGQTVVSKHQFELKKCLENNLSYAHINKSRSKDNISYYGLIDITNFDEFPTGSLPQNESVSIKQTNKLHVSALNNPFFTAATNVYTIGESSSVVDGICTAAEQITETKFGLYPLYVFTNRAIYALEVGSGEIVYQRVIGVSNDMKLPNTTMVGAGNLVFFIAARGVMAIEGRKIVCISEALNRYVGSTSADDLFQDYCTKGRLMYNPIENELILYNTDYAYAYIYSLAWRHWSRRSWGCREMGYQSEIYYNDKGVASAWIEDTLKPAADCRLESRAIKCGSLEYKRLETLVARISCGGLSNYEIKLLGSNDLKSWTPLSEANSQPLIRRTSASYKFFKVVIECVVGDYFAITNLDTEHYLRFVRRLR